jgi:hypothetical protein
LVSAVIIIAEGGGGEKKDIIEGPAEILKL